MNDNYNCRLADTVREPIRSAINSAIGWACWRLEAPTGGLSADRGEAVHGNSVSQIYAV